MKLASLCLLVGLTGLSSFALEIKIEELSLRLSPQWRLHQQAKHQSTELLGFEKEKSYLQVYVRPLTASYQSELYEISEAKIVKEYVYPVQSKLKWLVKETLKENISTHVAFARTESFDYLMIARGPQAESPRQILQEAITGMDFLNASTRSLTGPDYSGKKYYVGFGDYLSGFMGNEVKYDIAHTHDVFTKEMGGNYLGTKINGSQVDSADLYKKWEEVKSVMTDKDMYVQYSSGHGSHTGLMFGPSYNKIRDNALSYPAKEIIIFTMACYSGNLVDSFNQKKSIWQDWQSQGRTLMVMASSQANETSSTGPIHDSEEPQGPSGSAGSAFGHSLWKALIGHADGAVDGIKDYFLSLAEIREFTIKLTQKMGDHTPSVTGAYNDNLLMVKVPSKQYREALLGGTENLSEDQILEKIRALDAEWRLK